MAKPAVVDPEQEEIERLHQLDSLSERYLRPATELLNAPDPVFLIPQLILRDAVTLIVGESGSKKSWAAYDLIRAVATGTPWLGKTDKAPDLNAALFNYDNSTSEVKRRFLRLGIPLDRVRVHTTGVNIPPSDSWPDVLRFHEEQAQYLISMIQHNNIRLAVFDSLRQAHMAKEQDSQAMGEVMSYFRAIANAGCCCVVIHHSAKSTKDDSWQATARGSGEIVAHADTVIQVGSDAMTWTKTRGWNMGDQNKVKFRLEDDATTTTVLASGALPGMTPLQANLSDILDLLRRKGQLNFDGIKGITKMTRNAVSEALDEGKRTGVIAETRAGRGGDRIYEAI